MRGGAAAPATGNIVPFSQEPRMCSAMWVDQWEEASQGTPRYTTFSQALSAGPLWPRGLANHLRYLNRGSWNAYTAGLQSHRESGWRSGVSGESGSIARKTGRIRSAGACLENLVGWRVAPSGSSRDGMCGATSWVRSRYTHGRGRRRRAQEQRTRPLTLPRGTTLARGPRDPNGGSRC